jgi:hypothetical protein
MVENTRATTKRRPGRPRRLVDPSRVRRLRSEGRTLNEIAAAMGCGRGTVARALERTEAPRRQIAMQSLPLHEGASELARSRTAPPGPDAAQRELLRESARRLVQQRWGDGMKVEGRPYLVPAKSADDGHDRARVAGALLLVGGVLLWMMGCPVPL